MSEEVEKLAHIVEWARKRASIHHQLAHKATEDDAMRSSHIAISSAYREVAMAIENKEYEEKDDE